MADCRITTGPIDPQALLDRAPTRADGAVLLFLGVVRDHNRGREVEGITYEAYGAMAEEVLREIAGEARERFGTDRMAVLHRVGTLGVGEVATAIAVASPHRDEAYRASRYVIEEIKKRLPIWKKESYVDGKGEWLEGRIPPGGGSG